MTRVIRAQLNRFVRRRTIIAALVGAIAFALVATLSVFSSPLVAGAAARQRRRDARGPDRRGGGTEAFAVAASFAGFLVFVTVIALVGSEFSGGTFRALLLREPHRLRVIVGLLAGILIVAAGIVALLRGC